MLLVFQPIDYTSERGVSVVTNKAETTVSSLIIPNARIEDSGVYSCQNGQVDPAHVNVVVSPYGKAAGQQKLLAFVDICNHRQTALLHKSSRNSF